MDTQPISTNCCPKCHTPLPADAPQGLCPKCLFAAVATPTEAGQPAGHRATPPPVEEIAAAFPQLEILEFIGQGGMGFVFKARQPKLDRLVALKILPQSLAADPTFAERFNREAKLLARLSHPGIVTVHDFGVATGRADLPVRHGTEAAQQHRPTFQYYYLLMEFVDGVNLRQAMQAGRFTPEQALAIVPKICEALQFAHNEGILHRDIKPENILLDAKGRVKLADFGIAKLVGDVGQAYQPAGAGGLPAARSGAGNNTDAKNTGLVSPVHRQAGKPALRPDALTEAGKSLGTPNYMAPEQLANAGEVDHRADIYSLGVVFYEMLTGELPLGHFAPPSQKSAADRRVDEVVLRALEKEKTKRYASADEVRTQVETISTSQNNPARPQLSPPNKMFGKVSDWRTWSPFQSAELQEICSHMTDAERNETARRGAVTGVWLFVVPFLVMFAGIQSGRPGVLVLMLVVLAVFYVAFILIAQHRNRIFLCSTEWAKTRGCTPDKLPLFSFTRSSRREEAPTEAPSVGERELKRGGIVIVGRRNGKRSVVWRGVSTAFFAIVGCLLITMLVIRLFVPIGVEPFIVAIFLAALVTAGGVMMGLRTPVELLAPLDDSTSDGSRGSPAQSQSGKPIKPRLTLRVVAGAVWVVLVIMAIISILPEREDTTDNKTLARRPDKLRRLPTDRLVQVALAEPQTPWAWHELEKHAKAGQLHPDDGRKIFDGLTAWLQREHPQGYRRSLFDFGRVLKALNQQHRVDETNVLAFLDAYCGSPSIEPLPRLRENSPIRQVHCVWRSPWFDESLGFELLNEMRSITIDDRQVLVDDRYGRHRNRDRYIGDLKLPKLAPGKHVVRCEVDSAFIATEDMRGLANDASSEDWPPAKRRWSRVCEAEFMVYAENAEIVKLSDDPALNPVTNGALSARQVIIRSARGKLTATVSFNAESKPGLPISFDVALRLPGQTINCGKLFTVCSAKSGARGAEELTADIGPLDPEIKEAEILLTPNPKAVEEYPYVDRIWGKEIVISNVPLSRQDLYGAKPSGSTKTP